MFRKVIKKLNNFRFTALLMTIITGVCGIYSLLSLFLYHFSGPRNDRTYIRTVGFNGVKNGSYLGMIVFFTAIIGTFLSIYIVYSLVPYLKNKEKLSPRKGLLLSGFIGGIVQIILWIFMILLITLTKPLSYVFVIVSLPFGIISAIASILYIVPFIKCEFYMPAVNKK